MENAIIENLKSMGYEASHATEIKKGENAGQPCNRIFIKQGMNVTAYLDLGKENPALRVFTNYPDGYTVKTTGEIIHGEDATKTFNRTQENMVRGRLIGPVIAAYVAAVDGIDMEKLVEGFNLKNDFKPEEREAEAEQSGPAPSAHPAAAPGR